MKQYNMFDTNLIIFAKQKDVSPTSLRGQKSHEKPNNEDDDKPENVKTTSEKDSLNIKDSGDDDTKKNNSASNENEVDQTKEGDVKEEIVTSKGENNDGDDKRTTDVQSEEIENQTNSSTAKEMPKFETGSFGNCTRSDDSEVKFAEITSDDGGIVQVTCKAISFRAQIKAIYSPQKIITGVLSGASGDGPARRDLIRRTWASGRNGIFFLVAGPWKDIEKEYKDKGDLIWIDDLKYEGDTFLIKGGARMVTA